MVQRYLKSSGDMASSDSADPIDVCVGKAARLHQTTVPDVDELTRWLGEVLDSTSYTIHAGPQFRGAPTRHPIKEHEQKNSRRRDRDLSWVLIVYLVGVAGLLSAAAYRLLS